MEVFIQRQMPWSQLAVPGVLDGFHNFPQNFSSHFFGVQEEFISTLHQKPLWTTPPPIFSFSPHKFFSTLAHFCVPLVILVELVVMVAMVTVIMLKVMMLMVMILMVMMLMVMMMEGVVVVEAVAVVCTSFSTPHLNLHLMHLAHCRLDFPRAECFRKLKATPSHPSSPCNTCNFSWIFTFVPDLLLVSGCCIFLSASQWFTFSGKHHKLPVNVWPEFQERACFNWKSSWMFPTILYTYINTIPLIPNPLIHRGTSETPNVRTLVARKLLSASLLFQISGKDHYSQAGSTSHNSVDK